MQPEITILTLFSGRFNLLEPYLYGLDNLDYPKDKLKLLWVTNNKNKFFLKLLEQELEIRKKEYSDAKLVLIDRVPISSISFVEKGKGNEEHTRIITKMYNHAFPHINTKYFLSLEDDVYPSYNSLKRLLLIFQQDPDNTAACAAPLFERHDEHGLIAWNLAEVRTIVKTGDREFIAPQLIHTLIEKPWGVQPVHCFHMGTTLVETGKLAGNNMINPRKPFKVNHQSCPVLVGHDIVMGVEFYLRGFKTYMDFDIRSLHLDSKGQPH